MTFWIAIVLVAALAAVAAAVLRRSGSGSEGGVRVGAMLVAAGFAALVGVAGGTLIAWRPGAAPVPADAPPAPAPPAPMAQTGPGAATDAATAPAAGPSQAEAEANMPPAPPPRIDTRYRKLLEQLRATVAERPDDLEGQILLARHEANVENYRAAYEAKARVIALKGADANADDYTEQAELMILAAGGYVSPEADAALAAALQRDPRHGPARFYRGLRLAQAGRPDLAFGIWEATLRDSPPDAPWAEAIRARIEEVAWQAGVLYVLPDRPAPPSGPGAAEIAASRDMSVQERQAMIRGMVGRLSERLASEGGSAEEWARLIRARAVLGEREAARQAWADAKAALADDEAALALIEAAAKEAGLIR